ncbi:MAG: TonB family protein [Hyphomicrobiales bacterium]|nr:TonB family protein [Hyphomicrobiales bacterium]
MPHAAFEPEDPDLAIPRDALLPDYRDLPERFFRAKHDGLIPHKPVEPLAPRPSRTRDPKHKWKLTLLASLILHAVLALFFVQANDEAVQMEGAEYSGAAEAGNADADATSAGAAGEFDNPVEVTMITMLEARPVAAIEAQAVPVEAATEAVETADPVAAEAEPLQPVEEADDAQVEIAQAATPPDKAATGAAEPDERLQAEVADIQVTATTNKTVPEVLATDQPLPAEENNAVQKALETQATIAAETSETTAAEPIDKAQPTATDAGESTKTAASEDPEPLQAMPAAKMEPVEKEQIEPAEPLESWIVKDETVQDEPARSEAKKAETTQKKPAAKKAAAAKEKPKKAEPAKKAPAKSADKPKSSAGSGGTNEADAKRGQNSSGQSASSGGGGKSSAAGNASVSNYPGKVASKLRRALRYPADAKRQKLRGVAQVSFVISASGGVGSIRLASSSGSPILDKAALEAVRRAAPFPAIPANAGRSSWPFSVPLAFNR